MVTLRMQKQTSKCGVFALILLVISVTAMAAGPFETGPYTGCRFDSKAHLTTPEYKSAVIYYPCETAKGPFAATTLTGGWTNVLEDMNWISRHIVTHGYVVIAITPNDNLGKNRQWRRAHNAGVAKLKSENQRRQSPLFGLINADAMQIMGFSKGGGGALMAGSDQAQDVKSVLAMAPYADGDYDLAGIRGATLLLTSSADKLALAENVRAMFQALPAGIDKTIASFHDFGHLEWLPVGLEQNHARALTLIVAWMKVHLDGDFRYNRYLDGHQPGWFEAFTHLPIQKEMQ